MKNKKEKIKDKITIKSLDEKEKNKLYQNARKNYHQPPAARSIINRHAKKIADASLKLESSCDANFNKFMEDFIFELASDCEVPVDLISKKCPVCGNILFLWAGTCQICSVCGESGGCG